LLKQSTSVKSIRDQVKEKYGDLKAASFVQYFASPEFTGMATKALARPVVVQVVAGADEAKSKLYSPGSLLVYADGHDLAEYGYVNIGPEGKALDGGAGVDHIQQ
jgi:hypothetical protein